MPHHPVALSMIKIPVTDIARSIAFYRDVLGLPEEFSVPEYGWAQFHLGDLPFCLYIAGMGGGQGIAGGCDSVHLATPDLVTMHSALVERGALMPDGLRTGDNGTKYVDVYDPDGNIIKLVQVD